ncbi:MAG: tRNA glutamyl-Q(34) synthetase GluQRS [Cardiobacteriaceae bacterium]|nr:tRNA glutamyl-Q(34) synthetase GluQRS [Cardiobacteriaceae bacterium]
MHKSPYLGRFAPTPSGHLHFGSLVAALGSFLDARAHGGQWLIRIEDVDRTRSRREYTQSILAALAAHGMSSDAPVRVQSEHLEDYEHVLAQLRPHLYPCDCSRKVWHAAARVGHLGNIYPGFCRNKPLTRHDNCAIRLRLPPQTLRFADRHFGAQTHDLQNDIGDPIVKRRDGDIAYALAVTVDDARQGITDVVRGADLLAATPIQQYLQTLLGYPPLRYLHLPLVLDDNGNKFSKQNHAPALDNRHAAANLLRALDFLGQSTDGLAARDSVNHILATAAARWDTARLGQNRIYHQTP